MCVLNLQSQYPQSLFIFNPTAKLIKHLLKYYFFWCCVLEQCHAGANLESIRIAENGHRIIGCDMQQHLAYLDQPRTEDRVCVVVLRFG